MASEQQPNISNSADTHAPRKDLPALGRSQPTVSLFVVSVLCLFLELMLIRWIGTEVRIFAYLQNTVLVVCFLGLGVGCFSCREPVSFRALLLHLLILVLLFAIPLTREGLGTISAMLGAAGDFVIWQEAISTSMVQTFIFVVLGLTMTYCLMWLVWEMFVPIGRLLGRLMNDHPRTIWAYSVNVAGSLLGILLFVLLSVLDQPPFTWLVVLAVMLLFFLGQNGRQRWLDTGLLLAVLVLGWFAGQQAGALEVHWSPYQKLVLLDAASDDSGVDHRIITVNNAGYQVMIDLRREHVAAYPQRYPPDMRGCSQYDIPLLLHPNPQTMLVVGAGAGNDAAGGLRHGVESITAVEIDPAIIDLGNRYHPEKPYDSANVRVVNDDARSYFASCDERFDVISFGLLDSHTQTAMTNARLDHYVYTIESIQQAKSLLGEGGILALTFEAKKPFIADRMARLLRDVFGAEPISFRIPRTHYGWGGVMFVAGALETAKQQIANNSQLNGLIEQWQHHDPVSLSYTTPITSDDWPYVYLETPSIPRLFYFLAALMFLLLIHHHKQLKIRSLIARWARPHWHFFFLGAAFMLLEVQNISKASVVLGNTWWVNAVIISGILIMVLLANAIAALWPKLPTAPVYAGLCASCVVLYMVDISRFAFLPFITKAVIVGAVTAVPMLFSGIVFIRSFARVESKAEALGANLIGALVGALLQSITFVTGIKALLLIVTGLYVLAMLTRFTTGVRRADPLAPAGS